MYNGVQYKFKLSPGVNSAGVKNIACFLAARELDVILTLELL